MLWLYAMKCNLWEGLIGSETELMNLKYNFFTEKKVYRLARTIHETTRLIADNYGTFVSGTMEDYLFSYIYIYIYIFVIAANRLTINKYTININ